MADRLNVRLVIGATDRASGPLRGVQGQLGQLGESAARMGQRLSGLGRTGLARITLPAAGLAAASLRAYGSMEQMETGFKSLVGGAKPAADMMERLSKFSARTPFQLTEIGRSARMMLNAGTAVGGLGDELRMIGDIAAGAQVPLGDMAAIYSKAMTKGRVQTEELNQMSERGVPIMDALVELAATYGKEVSKEDVYKAAEKGQIRFRHLREALGLLTAEGGKFHRQMEMQSGTLFGLWSTLKDNVFLLAADIGEELDKQFGVKDGMRELIAWVGEAREGFKTFAEEHPELTKLGASVAAIGAALPAAALGLGLVLPLFGPVARGFRLLGAPIRGARNAIRTLRTQVDRGPGSMRVSGVTGPLTQVRTDARLTNRGIRAMGATIAAGAGQLGVAGVTGPLATVRNRIGMTSRLLGGFKGGVRGGLPILGVAGVLTGLGEAQRATGETDTLFHQLGDTAATVAALMGGPWGIAAAAAWTLYRNWSDVSTRLKSLWQDMEDAFKSNELFRDPEPEKTRAVVGATDAGTWLARTLFGDGAGGAPSRPLIFRGEGELASAAAGAGPVARVGGIIGLQIDVRGAADVRTTELRTVNPDVPIQVDTGYLALSP